MSEPRNRIPDELISAYLDGELDSQQHAQVEHLLDSESRFQQMLEELRTLRETLHSLPRRRLDAGFHERVLRKAAQRSAAATQVTPAGKSASRDARGRPSGGFLRGLFWAAAAVAAAILLSTLGPEVGRDRIGPVALNEPALNAPDSTPAPVHRESEVVFRGCASGQDEGRSVDGWERGRRRRGALDEPANGVTSYGVRAGRPKGGRETAELEAPLGGPDDPFDAAHSDASGQADAHPKSGAEFDFGAHPQTDLKQAARAALGGIVPIEAAPVAGTATDTSSAEWLADAVIYIRLAPAEKSPEARLTENLVRNQIAVVRQEPTVAQQPRPPIVQQKMQELRETQDEMELEARTRKERAVYFTDQAAVDLAWVPTEVEVEPVKLYLVQAPVTQIATAVNQLQEEGGMVLAALPGPRPDAAPLPEHHLAAGSRAGRSTPSLGTTATKGVPRVRRRYLERQLDDHAVDLEAWDESMSLERMSKSTTDDRSRGLQEEQPSDDAVPAPDRGERDGGTRTNGRDGRPDQPGSWYANEPVSPPASSPSQVQPRYPYRTLFRDPQQLQKQLVDLTAGRGGERPLQFLIVLHGPENPAPPAATEAAEAAPTTAEPAANSCAKRPALAKLSSKRKKRNSASDLARQGKPAIAQTAKTEAASSRRDALGFVLRSSAASALSLAIVAEGRASMAGQPLARLGHVA